MGILEDLKDAEAERDWRLIMEAFNVLVDPEARAEYEERNLSARAKTQLVGLRVQHEIETSRAEAKAAAAAEVALAALEGTPVRAEGHGGLGDDLAESLALLADRVGVDRSGGELVVPAAAKGLHLRGEGAEERGDVELREEGGEHGTLLISPC